ncbi:MAG: peroxiredoxin [Proteobacteria bacterium]|nr:peroxiredoxin [Pseudomonadota bacterium]
MIYKQFQVLVFMGFFSISVVADIAVNDKAPAFELIDQNNELHRLSDYSGKWLVLYFYPKDDTPGCTKEACSFRDDIYKIRELKAEVIGVSTDDVESHAEFAEKYNLPFPLLADTNAIVAKSYGSAWKLGPYSLAKRHSFIINPEGKIVKIYRKVDPDKHSAEIIADLKTFQKSNTNGIN